MRMSPSILNQVHTAFRLYLPAYGKTLSLEPPVMSNHHIWRTGMREDQLIRDNI